MGDWYLNLVVVAAFIVGGIGFPVVFELRRAWRRPREWSLHTKVTLATTALLLFGGTLMVAAVEWNNAATIGGALVGDKVMTSFFPSATSRTAGFNTVPVGELRTPSLLIFLPLMVIGAVGTATFLLTWFDPNLPAVDLLFEAASAFGTVGMSTGLTPELSAPSRVLIIVLMFVGRVGPITFGTAVLLRPQQQRYGYASEGLTVG